MQIDYQKICSKLLKGLNPRVLDVIERRFGLKSGKKETLELIGEDYGLTRERIRQIEREGFSIIYSHLKDQESVFRYFKDVIKSFGGLKEEKSLLNYLAKEKNQNCLSFLLRANNDFKKVPEDDNFHFFWIVDKNSLSLAKKVVNQAIKYLQKQKEPLSLEKLFKGLQKKIPAKLNKNAFQSYLEISKKIQNSPEGLYGIKDWIEINPRGVKDKAYLVLRKKKMPLHFKNVADLIEKLPFSFSKKIQTTTVHNELIKDDRFILVGRGLYALKEWGYRPGTVKDIIVNVLKESKKPLTKKEISEKILKERFVKKNTVFLNLSDKAYFLKDEKGRYKIREA